MGNVSKTSPGVFICSEVDHSLGLSCSVGKLGVVLPAGFGSPRVLITGRSPSEELFIFIERTLLWRGARPTT